MTYVCLWSPVWSTGEGLGSELAAVLPAVLAEVAPRIRLETRRVWVDGRGLPVRVLAHALVERLRSLEVEDGRVGVADVPVAAELAARTARVAPRAATATEQMARTAARAPAVAELTTRAEAAPVAESATRVGESLEDAIQIVDPGAERAFLAPLPLAWLDPDPRVLTLLEGVGIATCGELATRESGAVEVRFGAEGTRLWRLARADDPRHLFDPIPPERPHASLDFVDYVVTDPERLIFTANALLGSICDVLREKGEHARNMMLRLSLANGESWSHGLRAGRPTASRAIWLRLTRAVLERLTVPDAVAEMALEVEAMEPATVRQGDLFDAGFATASAAEAAVLRLIESQGEVVVRPEMDAHLLAERRTHWVAEDLSVIEQSTRRMAEDPPAPEQPAHRMTKDPPAPEQSARRVTKDPPKRSTHGMVEGRSSSEKAPENSPASGCLTSARRKDPVPSTPKSSRPIRTHDTAPQDRTGTEQERAGALMLQLLPAPRAVRVETAGRRDHVLPVRYRDRGAWRRLIHVLGPDRVSGERWEAAFAREYYRAVREDGVMVWLFRDALQDAWYLHGWWD